MERISTFTLLINFIATSTMGVTYTFYIFTGNFFHMLKNFIRETGYPSMDFPRFHIEFIMSPLN